MAKQSYIGIDGTARKVKNMYIGIDNVARKIKKAYIGINGVARLFYSGSLFEYYGVTSMNEARYNCPTANIGDKYLLIAGGRNYPSTLKTVESYNTNLAKTTFLDLPEQKQKFVGVSVNSSFGTYAVFAGGYNDTNMCSSITAYDADKTKLTMYNLSQARCQLGGTAVGDKIIFGGGDSSALSSSYESTRVDAYTAVGLAATNPSNLSYGKIGLSAAATANYAFFFGGMAFYNDESNYTIDVYKSTLTKQTSITTTNSVSGGHPCGQAAVSFNGYALALEYYGGYNVMNINNNLVQGNIIKLSATGNPILIATQNYAICATPKYGKIYVIDKNLTKISVDISLQSEQFTSATDIFGGTIGDYILVGGDYDTSNNWAGYDTIDIFKINE